MHTHIRKEKMRASGDLYILTNSDKKQLNSFFLIPNSIIPNAGWRAVLRAGQLRFSAPAVAGLIGL